MASIDVERPALLFRESKRRGRVVRPGVVLRPRLAPFIGGEMSMAEAARRGKASEQSISTWKRQFLDLELEAVVGSRVEETEGDAVRRLVPEEVDVDAVAGGVRKLGPAGDRCGQASHAACSSAISASMGCAVLVAFGLDSTKVMAIVAPASARAARV